MRKVLVAGILLVLGGCGGIQNRPIQLVSGSGPVYPKTANTAGVEGMVVVRYDVSVDGRVINARVDSSEPSGVFEAAALAAVRSWRYNPAIRDGEPIPVQNVLSTVRFLLDDGDVYDNY
ncbi:MAG: TonB family protein [Pseudomonadales bacterium]